MHDNHDNKNTHYQIKKHPKSEIPDEKTHRESALQQCAHIVYRRRRVKVRAHQSLRIGRPIVCRETIDIVAAIGGNVATVCDRAVDRNEEEESRSNRRMYHEWREKIFFTLLP